MPLRVRSKTLLFHGQVNIKPPGVKPHAASDSNRFHLRAVASTRGAGGSLLYSDDRRSERPGQPVKLADTVGAGDAFTAALALGLLAAWPLVDIHRRAADLAAYVCSQPGGTPELPQPLRAPFMAAL